MAKIHRVLPGVSTDLGWTFVAHDQNGHIAADDTIASVTSVKAYDGDGAEVTGVFAETPVPSVGDDGLTVYARCSPAVASFTEDVTLWVEVLCETTNSETVMWTDNRGERPRLWINARP